MRFATLIVAVGLLAAPTTFAGTGDQPFLFMLDDGGSDYQGTLADGLTFHEDAIGIHIGGTNYELIAGDAMLDRSFDGLSLDPNTGDLYFTHEYTTRTTTAEFGSVALLDGDIAKVTDYTVDAITGQIIGGDVSIVTAETTIFEGTGEDIDALHLLANGNFLISTTSDATLLNGGSPLTMDESDVVEITPAGLVVGWLYDFENDSDGVPGNEIINPGSGSTDTIDDILGASWVMTTSGYVMAARSVNGIAINDGETHTLDLTDLTVPYDFDFDMDGLLLGGDAVGQDAGGDCDDLDGLDQLDDTERWALIDALGGAGTPIADALIPEPGTLALLLVGGVFALRRRR